MGQARIGRSARLRDSPIRSPSKSSPLPPAAQNAVIRYITNSSVSGWDRQESDDRLDFVILQSAHHQNLFIIYIAYVVYSRASPRVFVFEQKKKIMGLIFYV
uniref:Uncharacterized protein n=1 Tax=Pristionchus pacificus TaxID=54126 RepID=A0A2A6BSK5_PRIPA|eukprot:PDM68855.1 hypothetical protein PRIPAC_47157 [Pristionchus pacificus]